MANKYEHPERVEHPERLSLEETRKYIRAANSPAKIAIITEASQKQVEAKSLYNRGALTPLDYAEQCYQIWAEAEQKLRR